MGAKTAGLRFGLNLLALAALIVCVVFLILGFMDAGQLPPTAEDNAAGGNAEANVKFYIAAVAGGVAAVLSAWGQLKDTKNAWNKMRNIQKGEALLEKAKNQ